MEIQGGLIEQYDLKNYLSANHLEGAALARAHSVNDHWEGTLFLNSSLNNFHAAHSLWLGCRFLDVQFQRCEFNDCTFRYSYFKNVIFIHSQFQLIHFVGCQFEQCEIEWDDINSDSVEFAGCVFLDSQKWASDLNRNQPKHFPDCLWVGPVAAPLPALQPIPAQVSVPEKVIPPTKQNSRFDKVEL